MSSWRGRLLEEGTSPDPRMSLANERTFLAWIRTSLAMIAGGVSLDAFVTDSMPAAARITLATVLLLLGAALAIGSFRRWYHAEQALRRGEELPVGRLALLVAGGLSAVALALVVVVLVRH